MAVPTAMKSRVPVRVLFEARLTDFIEVTNSFCRNSWLRATSEVSSSSVTATDLNAPVNRLPRTGNEKLKRGAVIHRFEQFGSCSGRESAFVLTGRTRPLTMLLPQRVTLLVKGDEAGPVQRCADIHARIEVEGEVAVDAVLRDVRVRDDGVEREGGR